MITADQDNYGGNHVNLIRSVFAWKGITEPPSVTISGPQYVYPGSYPTWTANPSGGTSPYQYYWQENDHYRDGLTSGWQYFGNQQSESRTYESDIERVELQVTVTDASSGQATATFTSHFEQSNAPVTTLTDPTPNPFNPTTVLNYSLAKPAHVKLMIYNILGQQVATLVDANQTAGKYRKTFDAFPRFAGPAEPTWNG
ncbi:MAG TPA: hypothetical protein VKA08_04685 [Balneolales bacterium]|jgi:hypothetical protein|nr:hypothetical protein [Balneolales bacterium]